MEFEKFINSIKEKKELQSLSYEFILGILEFYLQKERPKLWSKREWLYNKKSKEYRSVLKDVRKILREVYGAFKKKEFHKREIILDEIKSLNDIEKHIKILKLHRSTSERLPYYFEIYGNILENTDKIDSLLDLGAGLNPFSMPFMHFKVKKYYAIEITEEDVEFINRYFKRLNIDGHAFVKDLTKVDNLPKVDVCFMFKLVDTLESLKKDVTKELLSKIKCRWLIVSFATKSLGGKKTISKKRSVWFKRLIKDYNYKTFEVENEFFYIIKKD